MCHFPLMFWWENFLSIVGAQGTRQPSFKCGPCPWCPLLAASSTTALQHLNPDVECLSIETGDSNNSCSFA
jgi:hypothetical protein